MTGDDHALARDLAALAGERLLALRAQGGEQDELRKAGDRQSHDFLTAELAARRPGDVVLSEEGADNPARLAARRVWIVDPLDGTREFGEPGRTDWAVHVALWERSDTGDSGDLTAGAVALPAQGMTLSTADLQPAQSDIEPVITGSMSQRAGNAGPGRGVTGVSGDDVAGVTDDVVPGKAGEPGEAAAGLGQAPARIRIVVSRSRPPAFVRNISGLIDAEL